MFSHLFLFFLPFHPSSTSPCSPFTPLYCPVLTMVSVDNCAVSQRQGFARVGGGRSRIFCSLQSSFHPKSFLHPPPPLRHSPLLLRCFLLLFHSSFCLHRGMNLNHFALRVRSQFPPLIFLTLWARAGCGVRLRVSTAVLFLLHTPSLKGPENASTQIRPFDDEGKGYLVTPYLVQAKCV